MPYAAPALTETVTLTPSAYAPPALSVQVTLCAGETTVVEGVLTAILAPPTPSIALSGTGALVYPATGAAGLPAPAVGFTPLLAADQLFDLPDPYGPKIRLRWQAGRPSASPLTIRQEQGAPSASALESPAAHGEFLAAAVAARHQHGLFILRRIAERAHHGIPANAAAVARHQHGLFVLRRIAERAQHGMFVRAGLAAGHREYIRTRNHRELRERHGLPTALRLTVGHHQGLIHARALHARWQHAEWPKPGRWWPFYEPPPLSQIVVLLGPYTARPLHCTVLLHWYPIAQPYCVGLDPGPELPVSIYVPIREVYVVINTFSLIRVADSVEVPALEFSAALAADTWTWTWSATIPGYALSLVRPGPGNPPVELLATLNGTPIRLVAERLARERVFGQSTIRVSGRGRAAWLGEPYSPVQTTINLESRTAQQLIDDALKLNGVSIGWDVDWNLDDWTVPAGAWSHTGTYISAAQRVAEAGGAYIQAHRTAQTLVVKPWYPLAPWLWGGIDPDVALPDAVCLTEAIEWLDKPAYTAVWVVGGADGRRDKVRITGSAGDYHAPTVVDPLATSTTMTRQRGLRALGDTGRQALIDVSLPVLPETGILTPGLFVDYTEQGVTRRGLTRGVSVRYSFPTASQTVRIETHELVS